jgi:hypothetical protein
MDHAIASLADRSEHGWYAVRKSNGIWPRCAVAKKGREHFQSIECWQNAAPDAIYHAPRVSETLLLRNKIHDDGHATLKMFKRGYIVAAEKFDADEKNASQQDDICILS